MRAPYIVHVVVVALGALAVVTAARAARGYTGLSFFPPDPRTLAPAAATYIPLGGNATALRARRDITAAMGLSAARVAGALDLLASLGDRVGVVEWPAGLPGRRPATGDCSAGAPNPRVRALALIARIKVTDVVALTGDPTVKRRVGELRRGLNYTLAYTCAGVQVYRVTVRGEGGGYAAIVAGDGVFASDLAVMNRIIMVNR